MSPDNARTLRRAWLLSWLPVALVALIVGAGIAALAHWLGAGSPVRGIVATWGAILLSATLISRVRRRTVGWVLAALLALGLALIYVAQVR